MTSTALRIVVVICATLTLVACGLFATDPLEVSVAELAADHDRYDGTLVATAGVVRTHDDPRHYWIEDEVPNRVELIPHDEVAPLLGQEVHVVGVFTFSEDQGRLITIEEIAPVSEMPRAAAAGRDTLRRDPDVPPSFGSRPHTSVWGRLLHRAWFAP